MRVDNWVDTLSQGMRGLSETVSNPADFAAPFILANSSLRMIMVHDENRDAINFGTYRQAIKLMKSAAGTREPEIMGHWMEIVGKLEERAKSYFGRRYEFAA